MTTIMQRMIDKGIMKGTGGKFTPKIQNRINKLKHPLQGWCNWCGSKFERVLPINPSCLCKKCTIRIHNYGGRTRGFGIERDKKCEYCGKEMKGLCRTWSASLSLCERCLKKMSRR